MIIYDETKKKFGDDVLNGLIADKLEQAFWANHLLGGEKAEYNSWVNSLTRMKLALDDPSIPDDSDVAIEYRIPTTSKRIDFMIAGKDESLVNNVCVIELKQWESAEKTSLEDCVKTFTGGAERVVQHPCAQVYNYAKLLENVNQAVYERNVKLLPATYLHNYKEEYRSQLEDPSYSFYLHEVPMFLAHDTLKLRSYIRDHIKHKADPGIFDDIDHGKLKPSNALQDAILPMLDGKKEFYMIDEQQVAYSTILKLVQDSLAKEQKYTIVVQGGPGTGKSVIAITMLATLIKKGFSVSYVTKNAAPRNVFSTLLTKGNKRQSYVRGLFKGSGAFIDEEKDRYDCLLVDEAHRLNEKSGLYGNEGENQIKEIIHASKISVFFLDEEQIVTTKDIGSLKEIEKWAREEGSKLISNENLRLRSEFRCNGSDAYIAFIDDLLQIRKTANDVFDLEYEFRVYSSPVRMREDLRKLNEKDNKARMVAGYTYDWKSKKDNTLMDIVLPGGFSAQWNFNGTSTWAIDATSFDQVGCIHTIQGLELDYVGVIIGKDLVYQNGEVKTDFTKRSKMDASVKGLKSRADAKELGDKIVRDTYKVLLTRGQKGCFVYCEDEKLRDYFLSRGAKAFV